MPLDPITGDGFLAPVRTVVLINLRCCGPTETLNAAGNIFVGQTEAPLLIRPFLGDMTKSEIHAVMTGGCVRVCVFRCLSSLTCDFST